MSPWTTPKAGIYLIVSLLQRKIYVGKTEHFVKREWTHLKELSKGTHKNEYLQRSWDKYGKGNFEIIFWEECDVKLLVEREKFYIKYFNSRTPIGFNMTEGGDGGRMPPEIIEKNRLKRLGSKLSEEWKRNISKGGKGRVCSPETREAIGAKQRGPLSFRYGQPACPEAILALAKHYIFISPDGEKIEIYNLTKFCRENQLNRGHMGSVHSGRINHHKKWRKYNEQKDTKSQEK